ncbi:site-specific integrase [Aerococcaceae bacterium NML160702]|nr:site-specific integrase [Aerococcaceae bacterium NML160702]
MSIAYDEKRKTYTVKISYIDDMGNRRQTSKRGFKLKREAKEWENEYLRKVKGASNMTFSTLVDIYIEDCRHRLRETTIYGKEYMLRTKITPFFGHHSILDIDAKLVRKWQNWILQSKTVQGEPLSQTYLKTINNQLSAVLNFAVKFYGLKSNPVHKTGSIGKKQTDKINFWTLDEFNRFIPHVIDKPQNELCFNLLFYSGMRVGEMLALTLNDFDYSAMTVTISKSFTRLKGKDIITEPKTEKSKRTITLPEQIFKLLDDYVSKLVCYTPHQRLFTYSKRYYRIEIQRGCKLSGVKVIRVHDLRHSHASLLIELGFSALLISERLGHEDIQTTLNTYSHLYPSKAEEVSKKLKEVIERSH